MFKHDLKFTYLLYIARFILMIKLFILLTEITNDSNNHWACFLQSLVTIRLIFKAFLKSKSFYRTLLKSKLLLGATWSVAPPTRPNILVLLCSSNPIARALSARLWHYQLVCSNRFAQSHARARSSVIRPIPLFCPLALQIAPFSFLSFVRASCNKAFSTATAVLFLFFCFFFFDQNQCKTARYTTTAPDPSLGSMSFMMIVCFLHRARDRKKRYL